MATKAKKNQPAAAVEAAAETTKQAAPIADFVPMIGMTAEETKKRERGYSQTAIDKADLERLNALKGHLKESRKLSVSNQTIIAAALDCLAQDENMAKLLKQLVAAAGSKQRAKDMKQLKTLQAKLAQPESEE